MKSLKFWSDSELEGGDSCCAINETGSRNCNNSNEIITFIIHNCEHLTPLHTRQWWTVHYCNHMNTARHYMNTDDSTECNKITCLTTLPEHYRCFQQFGHVIYDQNTGSCFTSHMQIADPHHSFSTWGYKLHSGWRHNILSNSQINCWTCALKNITSSSYIYSFSTSSQYIYISGKFT